MIDDDLEGLLLLQYMFSLQVERHLMVFPAGEDFIIAVATVPLAAES